MKKNKLILPIATFSLLSSSFMQMLFVTARPVVLPTVLSEMNGMDYYSFCFVISAMAMATVLPIAGKAGDLYGKKKVYCGGVFSYLIVLLVLSSTDNLMVFILCIGGLGASYGIIISQQLALVVDLFDESKRSVVFAAINISVSAGSMLGPVMGGICVDTIGWRFAFWGILPIVVLNLIAALCCIPNIPSTRQNKAVDYKGIILFPIFIMPFLYALTVGGKKYAWLSVELLLMIAVSLVAFAFFMKAETTAENPIIDLTLFKKREYLQCLLVAASKGIIFSAVNYLPIYYQAVRGLSATASGMLAMPRQVGQMTLCVCMGIYLKRSRTPMKALAIATFCFAVSLFTMSSFSFGTMMFIILVAEVLYGVANGTVSVLMVSIAPRGLDKNQTASGLSLLSFVNTFGVSLGAAVAGCVINQFWNLEQVVPLSVRQQLSPEHLQSLNNTNILTDQNLINEIASTLPGDITTQFHESVEQLSVALSGGISTTFLLFAFIMTLVTISLFLHIKNKTK